ncbi:MAG TPA: NrfD/PsrC family molybdoenzyme membrane anchor subunit [Smithella sp.]|nr:NrfD/PsrC family molybdoenzyme membrane anchor subunit [Smithella sp.]
MTPEELWTVKELFVYPNEYVYWAIQIVMYPYMTGLVAGAFVLSSLYHLFGIKPLRGIARFSLVFSFALLMVAPLPLLLHLTQPARSFHVFVTPHFTSAIAAFGVVLFVYGSVVASELWFLFRKHLVNVSLYLRGKANKSFSEKIKYIVHTILTLGAMDVGDDSLKLDAKAIRILAGAGVPIACFLHGYAGFIFGSVKANALWMTPLMPVIFIMSAIVSGVALCMLIYIIIMEIKKIMAARKKDAAGPSLLCEIKNEEMNTLQASKKYLIFFMIFSISLELLDLVFRGYTAVKSWDIVRDVIYGQDFINIFLLQYTLGNLVPFILLLIPGLTIRRAIPTLLLVLFGVFMMRWNVVIGGQSFSLTFSGFMHYHMPIIPHGAETFKEGIFGVLLILLLPFVFFWLLNKIFPVFKWVAPDQGIKIE